MANSLDLKFSNFSLRLSSSWTDFSFCNFFSAFSKDSKKDEGDVVICFGNFWEK